MAAKKCSKCGLELPIERFYKDGRRGYLAACKSCHASYIRARREKDPEAYRAWHRDYRRRNPNKMRAYAVKAKGLRPTAQSEYAARSRKKSPQRALYNAAKSRAKKYGIRFTLSLSDILIPERCPILGIAFGPNTGRGMGSHGDSPSLDRIEPLLGYVPGNVQVISRKANTMKSNATRAELEAFADWVLRRKYGKAAA